MKAPRSLCASPGCATTHAARADCAPAARALTRLIRRLRYSDHVGLRDWPGWRRLDDLDRRSGFAPDGPWRPWIPIALGVGLVLLWFFKALTIGGSVVESVLSVAAIIGLIAVVALGGSAIQRWLSGQTGDVPGK